jgi:hypothetical protein
MSDRHPIADRPAWPLDERVAHVEIHLARLWDEVWWHTLPWYRRLFYWMQGFRSPIGNFYGDQ